MLCAAGSPPPTRGKAEWHCKLAERRGITPAYAGKGPSGADASFPDWDHPRLRGERQWCGAYWQSLGGSPPPTRGKEKSILQDCRVGGITPAYAGKGFQVTVDSKLNKDHPRLRGERRFQFRFRFRLRGSPPPTRGKVLAIAEKTEYTGITPAYAGKGDSLFKIAPPHKDHPRLRGERIIPSILELTFTGSPPPTRGKVVNGLKLAIFFGITPAYAGKGIL